MILSGNILLSRNQTEGIPLPITYNPAVSPQTRVEIGTGSVCRDREGGGQGLGVWKLPRGEFSFLSVIFYFSFFH